MYGTYDSYKTGHIWSMGTGYSIPNDGSDFGTLYGIAYKHTNNTTGGSMAGGHQAVFTNNGTAGAAISFSGGIWTSGTLSASGYNDSNWNTAYGWGNHASAGYTGDQDLSGYLPINSKAADSELLDGINSTTFVRRDTTVNLLSGSKFNFHSGSGGTTFGNNHYSMGVDIGNGGWAGPNYSDLIIGYHTGVRIGASYNGTRFYNNSPTTDTDASGNGNGNEGLIMTVGGTAGSTSVTVVGTISSSNFSGTSSGTNTGDQTNISGTFTGTITMGTQNALVANNYGRGVYGLYSATRYQHVWSMGTAYNLSDDGTSSGDLYGLAFTHTNIGGQSKSGLGHQLLIMDNGVTKSAIGNGIWTNGTITTTSHGTSADWKSAYTYSQVGHLTSSSTLNASNMTTGTLPDVFSNSTRYNIGLIDGNSTQTRDKIRVWNGSEYTIGMKSSYSYGSLGIGGDGYAMSFQMSNTIGRGFWWGDTSHSDAQGAMSLTTDGILTVAKSISIGQGETITTPSTTPLYVEGTVSGSTVFEVHGTQGQLFSISDDMTGDIFEVSDISGIPILTVNASGLVTIDDTLRVTGDVIAYSASDSRLKDNVTPISNPLDKLKLIGGYEFDWNGLSKNNGHDVGVIAQEIESVLPELVETRGDGFKGVKYDKLTALLIEANKELLKRVEELETKLNK